MKKSLKRKRKFVAGALLGVALIGLAGCGKKAEKAGTDKKAETSKLVVWTTSNAFKENADDWGKANDKEVSAIVIPYADFQTKLKQQISDPKTAPDVFIITRDFVKEWIEKPGVTVNMSKEFPKDIDTYKENAYSELVDLGSNSEGDVQAVTSEYPVGMMYFNREVAQKILGTDDLEEVAKALDSEEKWLEIDKKLKAEYGDKVKLFGSMLNFNSLYYQNRKEAWVKDDVFTIGDDIEHLFDMNKVLYDNKMYLDEAEGDAYFNGWNNNGFFIDFLPTWGFSAKAKKQIEGNEGAGKWGVTSPLHPYIRGGSFFFITESSSNKQSAWDFIKSISIDTDQQVADQTEKVGFPSSRVAAEKLVESNYQEPLLDNQEIFSTYNQQAELSEKNQPKESIVTKYDGSIVNFIADNLKDYAAGNITKEEALKNVGNLTKSAFPELRVTYK